LMEEYRLLGEEGDGRLRRKLDQFGDLLGLVVCRFRKASNDLNNLLVALVARRDESSLTLRRGW